MRTHWVSLGSNETDGIAEREWLWFAPQHGKVPAGGVSMTTAGRLWVLREEVASATVMRQMLLGSPLTPFTCD